MNNATTQTKRQQVEALLRARGLVEDGPGDWGSAELTVYLDIRHAPETAWLTRFYSGQRRVREILTYDELLNRLAL